MVMMPQRKASDTGMALPPVHVRRGAFIPSRQTGFTYLLLLFIVALTLTALSGLTVVWSQQAQRDKERELLAVGHEFRRAVERYYEGVNSAEGRRSAARSDSFAN
jgi:hypothetical protein